MSKEVKNEVQTTKIYQCKGCNKVCTSPTALSKHMNSKTCDTNLKDETSSFHSHAICEHCKKIFYSKYGLRVHLEKGFCKLDLSMTCKWCKVELNSRASLAKHLFSMHKDSSLKNMNDLVKCPACTKLLTRTDQMKFHIRREHFNLTAKIPYFNFKKVNQVWFEKVMNSDNIVEIKKTGLNKLLLRKLNDNTNMKVVDTKTDVIDLSNIYPIRNLIPKVTCHICNKLYRKKNLKKHIEETHYNQRKFHCNNCQGSFKRLYHFLEHICSKTNKRGKKRAMCSIENVKSLVS